MDEGALFLFVQLRDAHILENGLTRDEHEHEQQYGHYDKPASNQDPLHQRPTLGALDSTAIPYQD